MNIFMIESDHIYNESDTNEKTVIILFKTKTKETCRKNHQTCRIHTERQFIRKIQKMWKTKLQMPKESRSWAKILFINKFSKNETRARLYYIRTERNRRKLFKTLSGVKGSSRENMYDKSRDNPETEELTIRIGIGSQEKYFKVNRSYSCKYVRRPNKRKWGRVS